MRKLIFILDNIRSAHNVGSIFRTADGLGIDEVILCGITPYPQGKSDDARLPHVAKNADKMIQKTALGAEQSVSWRYEKTTKAVIKKLQNDGVIVASLEQAQNSLPLVVFSLQTTNKDIAVIVGPEVSGINEDILHSSDYIVEIPMKGKKESLNVSVAAALAMYELAKA